MKGKSRFLATLIVLTIAAVLVGACGAGAGNNGGASNSGSSGSSGSPAQSTPAALPQAGAPGGAATSAAGGGAAAGGGSGASTGKDTGNILILGAFTGGEADAFNQVLAGYNQANPGTKVVYNGINSFETVIQVRVQGGDFPDIAGFPQPGGVQRLAQQGKLVPLWDSAVALYDKNYAPAWKDLASVDGKVYGIFNRVNAKGMVWYNKPEWDKAGWQVPKTWDDLMSLSQQMIQKGGPVPFCEGIGAAAATGWKGTDWLENIVLRTQPTDFYDKWAAGQVKFSSPEIKNAFSLLGKIWTDPKMVYGGQQTIATTDVPTAATWLFDSPPKCWMHFEGSFVTNFFPDSVKKDLDNQVGFFMLPPIDPKIATPPLEVGGDEFVVFQGKDRPEVRKFMEWLGSPAAAETWAKAGGALFPYKGQDKSWYPTKIEGQMSDQLVNPKAAKFDASDMMPAKMNTAFWKGITDWVSGNRQLDQALQDIDTTSAQP